MIQKYVSINQPLYNIYYSESNLTMETLQKLSPIDKQLFYESLKNIENKLNYLVQRFYFYFLQTEAGPLFRETEWDNHMKMFHVSLAFLIAHIDNPTLLNKHLSLIVENHRGYGVESKHISHFIDSFISALNEFFEENDRIIGIWHSVIYEIMSFFNSKLMNAEANLSPVSFKSINSSPSKAN